jgi:methionyl-tRNA formyltransferase
VALIERQPAVALHDGWLVLEELQKPGGKRVTSQQYLAGQRGLLPGSVTLA